MAAAAHLLNELGGHAEQVVEELLCIDVVRRRGRGCGAARPAKRVILGCVAVDVRAAARAARGVARGLLARGI